VQVISIGESEYRVKSCLLVKMKSTFVIVVGRVDIMLMGV